MAALGLRPRTRNAHIFRERCAKSLGFNSDRRYDFASDRTWLWGWANQHLPANVTKDVSKVREFGKARNISQLTTTRLPDDEYLGWEMTAIAAKLLGARGAYRCPGENGFLCVVCTSIEFAISDGDTATESKQVPEV